ncbi:MAG: virulence factor SrfB [Alistipes sp.]|nr:virulence factor SrfB [Alistipes sp.]
MKDISLIANTGIHMTTFPLELDLQDRFKMWYHEWYDKSVGEWKLELAEQVNFDEGTLYYRKEDLRIKGYKGDIARDYSYHELREDGVMPIADDTNVFDGVDGEIFKMTFADKHNTLDKFINVWLPAPYFYKRTAKLFSFGSLNWARFKLVPKGNAGGKRLYDVVLAFDTRTKYEADQYRECPIFPDQSATHMNFALCDDEAMLMTYCSPNPNWSYIDKYLMQLVHPDVQRVSQIRGQGVRRLSYIASYVYLVNYIAKQGLFPVVELFRDTNVQVKDIDMIVDIGNSRTTALLVEDNTSFNQVPKLQLTDYTNLLVENSSGNTIIRRHAEPFDMRLAFRKVSFGDFGINNSRQFVYSSFVRLGHEANELIHMSAVDQNALETLSTYSSPKRYLWDYKPNKEEWRFLTLEGETSDSILKIDGLSEHLTSDGRIAYNGEGGITYNYSRRTLMTFSFLEMLVQARTQINGYEHRVARGDRSMPRRIKRIIVTCPTAMSKVERESLINCAKDAVVLLSRFDNNDNSASIEIVPDFKSHKDSEESWYYDEATCAQLVYMYGEVGYKYKGSCSEFFNLYGKREPGQMQNSLTLASFDIGAGTSDLMISKYDYTKDTITRITPDPQFYDSYYFAGDDMLESLIKNVMFMSERSAFRQNMRDVSFDEFQQRMKDFVGPDYHGQTIHDRIIRRDFNIQYSVPLMSHFLELVKNRTKDCVVRYSDVFSECPPNVAILSAFEKRFGFSLEQIEWEFNYDEVCDIISKAFEPLLKKVATIMFAHSCDIILLSGRPASLQPIREILLKYYCVSPNRLILLNNYFIGDWYPYDNNTGYIVDAKPIVAIGAAVAHYASELSNLNNFIIVTNKLQEDLKSTVNFIEASREGLPITYCITPEHSSGDMTVSSLPTNLNVRQLGIDSYPARSLYAMDFDHLKIADMIIKQGTDDGLEYNSSQLYMLVNEKIDSYKKRMPFKVTIEREPDDKEKLYITNIVDRFDNELPLGIIDLHIQSLGVNEEYWLDTGAFGF